MTNDDLVNLLRSPGSMMMAQPPSTTGNALQGAFGVPQQNLQQLAQNIPQNWTDLVPGPDGKLHQAPPQIPVKPAPPAAMPKWEQLSRDLYGRNHLDYSK